MWGSDWPVVDLAGGYARWRGATEALIGELSQDESNAILGGNAVKFYELSV
jgi:L-fuconolactonase